MRGPWLGVLLLVACEGRAPAPGASSESAPARAPASASLVEPAGTAREGSSAPQATANESAGERRFGAAPTLAGDAIPVAALLAQPDPYVGKQVKCSGKVARVCQAAGCWLELQADEGGEGLRVPMANHAFFIPRDAVGQHAVVEGELKRHPLPDAQREHYAGEGMQAMGPLSLDATSVVLR